MARLSLFVVGGTTPNEPKIPRVKLEQLQYLSKKNGGSFWMMIFYPTEMMGGSETKL